MVLIVFIVSVLMIVGFLFTVARSNTLRGKWGESVVRLVLSWLPGEYDVFYNVRLNFGGRRAQIDHVVVFCMGCFVRLYDRPANVLSFIRLNSYIRSFSNPVIPFETREAITRILSAQEARLRFQFR